MPNKPIEFKFNSDVTKLLRGLDKAEISVEDLEDAIKKLPKASDKAADDIGDDFRRAGDDARDAGRDMGGEFRQSLGEGLSSGGGDLSESLSETLGEAVGNAPLPLAAVGALALALWGHFKAESEKHKATVSAMFDLTDVITGEIDRWGKLEAGLAAYGGGDKAAGIKKATEQAALLGLEFTDIAQVLTGEINVATNQTYQYLKDQRAVAGQLLVQGKISSSQYEDIVQAQDQILLQIEDQRKASQEANAATSALRDTAVDLGYALDPAVQKTQEILSNVQNIPDNIRVGLEFYGNDELGKSLITRKAGGNYSPGHVAIAESYQRQANRSG